MASSGKRKTTMAKLNRERKLLERRHEKQAKKLARKQAADGETEVTEPATAEPVTRLTRRPASPENRPQPLA